MWHGDPRPRRRHVDWARLRAKMDRFVDEQRNRQANDNGADACARRFAESLEEAVLELESGPYGFEHAGHKAEHVEELRRVLGILLDVLADWEMLTERTG